MLKISGYYLLSKTYILLRAVQFSTNIIFSYFLPLLKKNYLECTNISRKKLFKITTNVTLFII